MIYVTLCRCVDEEGCGNRWTQSKEGDVTWETPACGRCGAEGSCVRVPGTEVDGMFKNVWCPENVLMTWEERT